MNSSRVASNIRDKLRNMRLSIEMNRNEILCRIVKKHPNYDSFGYPNVDYYFDILINIKYGKL